MVRQDFFLNSVNWRVTAFYAVTHYEVEEIIRCMKAAGAKGKNLETAYTNMTSGNRNTGLCYTGNHVSVLVISVAESTRDFANTWVHEMHHLATHIASELGYDLRGEEVCYLAGELAEKMFEVTDRFLCECCKQKRI